MALKFHNTTNLEATIGSTAMHASSNVNVTTTGVTSAGVTAPNLVNQATGIILYINSVPSLGNFTVELMESGVSKKSVTMNLADMQLGYNYVRFASPYTFATLTASAYTVKVTNTAASSGSLVQATSGLWFEITYDSTSSPANGDDIIITGWHDSGLTTKQWDISGTSTVFGNGTVKSMNALILRTMECALMIGNGATVKMDDTADCSMEVKGSIYITNNGVFDKRANSSDIEIVSTLVINSDVGNANYGIYLPPSGYAGQFLSDGKTVSVKAQYGSGVGTVANPLITQSAHGFTVNDEIVVPGTTYNGNQRKYVISIPSPTQLVVSDTLGGAENAITNSPVAGVWIGQMTRNSVVKPKVNTRGYYLYNNSTNTSQPSFNYTRWEYASCNSGAGLQFNNISSTVDASCNGMVAYHNSAAGRNSWSFTGSLTQTISDSILYETQGSNYTGQSGFVMQSATNKTLDFLLHYAAPGSTANCAGLSLTSSATNNTIKNFHSYGAGANNGSFAYALGIFASHGNTFNDCTINNARVRAMYFTDGFKNTFNNCDFGNVGNNVTDMFFGSTSLATVLFNSCSFGSTTRTSGVSTCLTGTVVAFQDIGGDTSKHGWETPNAVFDSSGAGLPDTTTRTPGSLALAIKPRNATTGGQLTFKVPANPTSNVQVYGYIYRNATFSSGDIICELFLPGTLLTDTPDDSFTLNTTTGDWQLWTLNAYNAGTVARYATVRLTAKTATAGAYAFLDDIYDATTNNKVAGMDLWDEGQISPIMLALDLSAVPEQTRVATWSDNNTYPVGSKGRLLADANDSAELASIR